MRLCAFVYVSLCEFVCVRVRVCGRFEATSLARLLADAAQLEREGESAADAAISAVRGARVFRSTAGEWRLFFLHSFVVVQLLHQWLLARDGCRGFGCHGAHWHPF